VKDAIRHVGVSVVLPEGADLETLKLWARNGGDGGKYREVKVGADGVADVAWTGDGVSLAACASGSGLALLETSARDVTLTLPPPLRAPVTIRLPAELSQRARESGASIELLWCGPGEPGEGDPENLVPRNGLVLAAPLPKEGLAITLTAAVRGWYQVRFVAGRNGATYANGDNVVLVAGKQPVSIGLDMSAAEIDDALDGR
jgi:hypothetical protein